MLKMKKILAVILAMLMLLSLAACGKGDNTGLNNSQNKAAENTDNQGSQNSSNNQQGSADNTAATESAEPENTVSTAELIRLAGGDWGYPTPFAHYSRGPGSRKKALIYDSLIAVDADNNAVPKLASEYTKSEDGLTFTFKLRSGVTWHDGQPFTAADVVFSYEYETQYPPVTVPDFSTIKSMEAVDELTVKIELTEADKKFINKLASFVIIPEHIWKDVTEPNSFTASAIGTGPYVLTDYNKEQGLYRYEAYEGFWGSKPRVKVIEFVPVSEEVLAFENGEIDRISITPDLLPRFEDTSTYKVMQYVTTWAYRLYFNMNKRAELKDIAFRQALAYGTDRQQMVDMIERGAAVAGNPGVLHPDNELYNAAVPQYLCDQQKAKDLLDGLSYKDSNGDGMLEDSNGDKLSFKLLCDSDSARLAELIKSQLAAVGINIEIQAVDSKTRDARFAEGDFEMCINGSGGGESIEELTNLSSGGKATSTTASIIGYSNEELDELYAAYKKETNKDKLRELMTQMQAIAAEEVPKLVLYYTNTIAVHRPAVYDGWSQETYHNDSRENFVED